VACLSSLATEVSAVTLISLVAGATGQGGRYILLLAVATLARLVVAFVFIPAFYRLDVTTIYELLAHRFGPATRATASVFFVGASLAVSGVRLMAAALVVAVLLAWPPLPVLVLFTLVCVFYIATGGVKAVAWANVFQAVVFVAGGAVTLRYVAGQVDGGLDAVVRTAGEAGWLGGLDAGRATWILLLTGLFGALAAVGTDHDVMQRLIAVRTRRQSQVALALTPLGTALTLAIYLALGSALATFYAQHPELPAVPADQILTHHVQHALPAGLRGLILAALVLASIDAPLAGLAASFVSDVYRPLIVRGAGEAHYLRIARACVVLFGLLLGAIAYAFWFLAGVAPLAFKLGGVTSGPLLGLFLLALLGRRAVGDTAAMAALATMALLDCGLLVLSEVGRLPFAWPWLVLVGTVGTVALALAVDALRRESGAPLPRPADTSETRTP
jgi:solute:Na+ symporter, SSS family